MDEGGTPPKDGQGPHSHGPVRHHTDSRSSERCSGTSARQAALAQNLANANTPGYQRKDVDFQGALRSASAGGKSAVERSSVQTVTDTSAALRADGTTSTSSARARPCPRTASSTTRSSRSPTTRISILASAMGIG